MRPQKAPLARPKKDPLTRPKKDPLTRHKKDPLTRHRKGRRPDGEAPLLLGRAALEHRRNAQLEGPARGLPRR